MRNVPRRFAAGALLTCAVAATVAPGTPAWAATKTTLVVSVAAAPQPPLPGKAVTYTVAVHNSGQVKAAGVQLELTTNAAMSDITAKVGGGRCYRSALETVCNVGTVNPGATATATVTGALPKDAALHSTTWVTAVVTSTTPLTAPGRDMLVYPLGGPPPQPTPPASAAAAPAPSTAVAAGSPHHSAVSLLQPTALTRSAAIVFAVLVVALIVVGRRWERRTATAVAGPATAPRHGAPAGEPTGPDVPTDQPGTVTATAGAASDTPAKRAADTPAKPAAANPATPAGAAPHHRSRLVGAAPKPAVGPDPDADGDGPGETGLWELLGAGTDRSAPETGTTHAQPVAPRSAAADENVTGSEGGRPISG